jgi:alpha-tubulin suppressor-like RCC1 family protein
LDAGAWHFCTLSKAGGMNCWGFNGTGNLGNGTDGLAQATPVIPIGMGSLVLGVTSGGLHSCAVKVGGTAYCWGENADGQLGTGGSTRQLSPVLVNGLASQVDTIVAGFFHSCAIIEGGDVRCWGRNSFGELGDGSTTTRRTPVEVAGLGSIVSLGAGDSFTCALNAIGRVFCWGGNANGELGQGTTVPSSLPMVVAGLGDVTVQLVVGANHACALSADGVAACWGDNSTGQLGTGLQGDGLAPTVPVQVPSSIARMLSATCGKDFSGEVYCWGTNRHGGLGTGTAERRAFASPVEVERFLVLESGFEAND